MPISVVSRISSVLNPSTPRKYCAPIDGIQCARSTNWNSGSAGSYQNQSGTETTKPARANRFAIQRMAFSFRLSTNRRRSAPASGVNRMSDSRENWRFVMMDASRGQATARGPTRGRRLTIPHEQIDAHDARSRTPSAARSSGSDPSAADGTRSSPPGRPRRPGSRARRPRSGRTDPETHDANSVIQPDAVHGAVDHAPVERPQPAPARHRPADERSRRTARPRSTCW